MKNIGYNWKITILDDEEKDFNILIDTFLETRTWCSCANHGVWDALHILVTVVEKNCSPEQVWERASHLRYQYPSLSFNWTPKGLS